MGIPAPFEPLPSPRERFPRFYGEDRSLAACPSVAIGDMDAARAKLGSLERLGTSGCTFHRSGKMSGMRKSTVLPNPSGRTLTCSDSMCENSGGVREEVPRVWVCQFIPRVSGLLAWNFQ